MEEKHFCLNVQQYSFYQFFQYNVIYVQITISRISVKTIICIWFGRTNVMPPLLSPSPALRVKIKSQCGVENEEMLTSTLKILKLGGCYMYKSQTCNLN